MDKANRAIAIAEDNAAQIYDISRRLKSRTRACCLKGTAGSDGGNTVTVFGNVSVSGDTIIIVAFDGRAGSLTLGEREIACGGSPIFAAVDEGLGALALGGGHENARALIFGSATVIQ